MADAMRIDITKEDDLWRVLEGLVSQELEDVPLYLSITEWQPELLYFPEERFGHSIRPPVARAINEYYKQIARTYALLVYGEANARRINYGEITEEEIHLIFQAAEQKVPIEAFVNAWLVEGRVSQAQIMRVNPLSVEGPADEVIKLFSPIQHHLNKDDEDKDEERKLLE